MIEENLDFKTGIDISNSNQIMTIENNNYYDQELRKDIQSMYVRDFITNYGNNKNFFDDLVNPVHLFLCIGRGL